MKYIQALIVLILAPGFLWSQTIDQERMQKDLEVAEKILETVLSHSDGPVIHATRNQGITGSYIKDYGVVFNVPMNRMAFAFKIDEDMGKKGVVIVDKKTEVVRGGADVDLDEMNGSTIESAKEFLAEYGSLIHQLQPSDKIAVRSTSGQGKSSSYVWLQGNDKESSVISSFSVEVLVADLQEYERGNIESDELYERIEVTETSEDLSREPQMEVFATLLDRLYQSDLSDTYYMAKTPGYDRMTGFGATYYLKFYSSRIYDNNKYSLPTIGKKDLSEEERNKIVEEMYPSFLENLKKNIIEYGYILKNLEPDEMLVLKVELTSCRGCDMPEEIEVSVKKTFLEEYRLGKLSVEDAMATINVRDL